VDDSDDSDLPDTFIAEQPGNLANAAQGSLVEYIGSLGQQPIGPNSLTA
jgi:hypothetical protein